MPKIISVSRRNDIPAFYGDWFMERLREKKAEWKNPFSGDVYSTPLGYEDVTAFAFWSKNFFPFLDNLKTIDGLGYNQFFNFTITGLPRQFEPRAPDTHKAVQTLKLIADIFSPAHINWRYDPIIISSITPRGFHIENFTRLCVSLEGFVSRCYISFVSRYGKVKKRFALIDKSDGILTDDNSLHEKISIAEQLAEIASQRGITIYSCCGDFLVNDKIKKGRCIDRDVISSITGSSDKIKLKGTRKECGCAESADIGFYGNCPHVCLYCYAN